jgi:hypothetical protein
VKRKAKVGADDYIRTGGKLEDLPRLEKRPIPAPLMGRVPVHPWLHSDVHGVIIGRVDEAQRCELVTSSRVRIAMSDCPTGALLPAARTYPDLIGRWPTSDVERWQTGEPSPPLAEVIAALKLAFDAFVELPRAELGALFAVYVLATYFHQDFLTVPRLAFSGERGSGKSKTESLLATLAWNGLMLVTPTPAVLFRLIAMYRPTLVLDEMEGLSKEDRQEIVAVVNSGYKRGARVPRVEGKEERRIETFDVYGPMALSAIRSLNWTTEDRAIPVVMQRGTDSARINREVDPTDESLAELRSVCHRTLLTQWPAVRRAYGAVPCPEWLRGRPRELWRPLLAIASAAEDATVTEELLALARDHVIDRNELSPEAEALVALLEDRMMGQAEVTLYPSGLADGLKTRLGWRDAPTPELVASWLRRLGFRRLRQTREGSEYRVTAEQLAAVAARHSSPDNCHTATATGQSLDS